jgi:hypothetical protein
MMSDDVEIKRFGGSLEPKKFYIHDDLFEAAPELPLGLLADLARLRNVTEEVEKNGIESIYMILDNLLFDESAALIRKRASNKRKPVGVVQIMELIPWLLEQYGLRPTQPSQLSSSGSSDGTTGTSSTGGRSLTELMQLSADLTEPSASSTTTS